MNIIPDIEGERCDVFLSKRLNLSRSRITSLIKEGKIKIDGQELKPHHKTRKDKIIEVLLPDTTIKPENLPLDIVYEDRDIIVVNKPPGQITHPTPKIRQGTLVNALLFHCPELALLGKERPGIVHRLDKDTSGLLVVAKTEVALKNLVKMIKERGVKRKYIALVWKNVEKDKGEITKPIGRPRKGGVLMKAYGRNPKEAKTFYKVLQRFNSASLLEIELVTGRTHQIRVHLASIGHPVIGDKAYGKKYRQSIIKRQALTAFSLSLPHPITNKPLSFEAPIPLDIREAIKRLVDYQNTNNNTTKSIDKNIFKRYYF